MGWGLAQDMEAADASWQYEVLEQHSRLDILAPSEDAHMNCMQHYIKPARDALASDAAVKAVAGLAH